MSGGRRALGLMAGLALAGCTSSLAPSPSASSSLPVVAEHPSYTVAASSTCAAAPCTLTFKVTARGGFHANAEYPHRFVPDEGGVVVDDAARSRRAEGATIDVVERYRPAPDGVVRGRLFMSVCSDDTCLIEKVPVTLPPST